jgi:predicted transcriptional regulator
MTEQERLEQEWLILLHEDDWASAVRRRLAELERTQEELARQIDVPLGRISRHLRGVGGPDYDEIRAVAHALANWSKAR